MPDSPYDLPSEPLRREGIDLPILPEALRDYGVGGPRAPDGHLPAEGEAQEARDRIEQLFAWAWDWFRERAAQPDGMSRLLAYQGYADRVLREAKRMPPAEEGDEAAIEREKALSFVRFRKQVLEYLLDWVVLRGGGTGGEDVPTWHRLDEAYKENMHANVRAGYTALQRETLQAGAAVARRTRELAHRYLTWCDLWEAVNGRIAATYRVGGDRRNVCDVMKTRFLRMGLFEPGGRGRSPSEEQVREFLDRVGDAYDRLVAFGAG